MASGDLRDRINVSVQAVAQVLLLICLGVWLARRRGLDRKAIAAVSGVNWHVLIPALMFSSIVGAVTPARLVLLWPMLLASLLHIVIGAAPAMLLCWAARLPKDVAFFAVMASCIPNCGNLPWMFMPSVIRYFAPPDEAAGQIQYMVGLVSVYTIITVIVVLVVPFMFKRPPDTMILPRRREAPPREQDDRNDHIHEQQDHQHHQQPPLRQLEDEREGSGSERAGDGVAADLKQQLGAPPGRIAHVSAAAAANAGVAAAAAPEAAVPVEPDTDKSPDGGSSRRPAAICKGSSGMLDAPLALQRIAAHHVKHGAHAPATAPGLSVLAEGGGGVSGMVTVVSHHSMASLEIEDNLHLPASGTMTPPEQTCVHMDPPHLPPAALEDFNSFVTQRSGSSFMLQSKQLFGSFSRSFRHSFNKGVRRSGSVVRLVWSYPIGWHQDRGAAARRRQQQQQWQQWRTGLEEDGGEGVEWPRWCRLCCRSRPPPCWLQAVVRAWRAVLSHPMVNVPLGATLLGIACAAVGPVRSVLVDELAPLHWLWTSLGWVGAASAPLATLQIGAELMQPPPVESRMRVPCWVQAKATAIAVVVKLALVPLINVAIVRQAGLGALAPPSDKVYQLLLLVEGAVPAAVTLLVVCARVYPDISSLSRMLMWQYVASLVTLPVFLVWFMDMLEV